MPIYFSCPHCHSQTIVDDQYAGQSGPCVQCGKPITIPAATATTTTTRVRTPEKRSGRGKSMQLAALILAAVITGVLGVCLLLAILFPAVQRVRIANHRSRSADNLRKIGLALRMYEAEHHCFPPAYVADKDGKPLYSWRVLLLPYMGHRGLYREFDLNQPWDSPANIQLIPRMPDEFTTPADDVSQGFGETKYLAIVGRSAVFREDGCTTSSEIGDGLSNTIMVVEANVDGVVWTKPQDLNVKSMDFTINGKANAIGGVHPDGANVLMADESIRFLPNDIPAEYVEGLTTRNGGEVIPLDDEQY
jgi:hypothetical protein